MNILVTFGPGHVPIDDVRRITNVSTGRLGTVLCNFLSNKGHQVWALRAEMATCRDPLKAHKLETFSTIQSLEAILEKIASENPIDVVLHAAALPDFEIKEIQGSDSQPQGRKKISSREQELTIHLKPAPKLILKLRSFFPKAALVGWKYELDGNRDTILKKCQEQMRTAQTNLCVANGTAYGKGFGICSPEGWQAHDMDGTELAARVEAWALV